MNGAYRVDRENPFGAILVGGHPQKAKSMLDHIPMKPVDVVFSDEAIRMKNLSAALFHLFRNSAVGLPLPSALKANEHRLVDVPGSLDKMASDILTMFPGLGDGELPLIDTAWTSYVRTSPKGRMFKLSHFTGKRFFAHLMTLLNDRRKTSPALARIGGNAIAAPREFTADPMLSLYNLESQLNDFRAFMVRRMMQHAHLPMVLMKEAMHLVIWGEFEIMCPVVRLLELKCDPKALGIWGEAAGSSLKDSASVFMADAERLGYGSMGTILVEMLRKNRWLN